MLGHPMIEDIAFKSVYWEWEYGYKKRFLFVSFKTTFSDCGSISNNCTIEDRNKNKKMLINRNTNKKV